MNFTANLNGIAAVAAERLLYGAVAGTLLALAVWLLLRLFPRRDSRTNFAVWFATLLATAVLPLLSSHSDNSTTITGASHAVVTISTSWAWYIFLIWAIAALAGLARVALATVQVRRLRAEASLVDVKSLPADLRVLLEELQRSRPVSLLVSRQLEVPTAIGFRKPAVILPAWLLESTPPEELKYILLHELAHLWRRDDWTNLAQKVLKALLFFLPSVWWIERRLSLDREMACDEAVLAHSGTPRGYAECLARVAEKSFLRRQIALAQAAVGRMRQLTARVAMILDPNRPRATHLWKPAIPVVIVLAGLCALPASFAPPLVGFADNAAATNATDLSAQARHVSGPQAAQPHSITAGSEVRAVPASFRTDSDNQPPVKAKNAISPRRKVSRPRTTLARESSQPETLAASYQPPAQEKYITVRQEMFLVVTQQTPSGQQQSWQMHIVEVSVQPESKPVPKPRKI